MNEFYDLNEETVTENPVYHKIDTEDIRKANKLMYGAAVCTMGVITLVKMISWLRNKDK